MARRIILTVGADVAPPPVPDGWRYGPLASYQPGAATTGVPAGTVLTRMDTNDVSITTGGTAAAPYLIEDRDIFGNVKLRASYITLRRCRIWGSAFKPPGQADYAPIVSCEQNGIVGSVIEDCTIFPQDLDYRRDGIGGHHYTARRNNISGCTDGFGVMNSAVPDSDNAVVIEGNYVHDLAYRQTPNPPQSDLHTHNDGMQIHSGSNILVRGNYFRGFTADEYSDIPNPYASSGNQITGQCNLAQTTRSSLSDIHILDNWYAGGGEAQIHATQINAFTNTGIEIKRNKHARDSRVRGGVQYTIRMMQAVYAAGDVPLSGIDANIYTDTGLPVTVMTY